MGKNCTAYTSVVLAHNLLSDWFWVPLLYIKEKNGRMTMEFEVPERPNSKPTLFIIIVRSGLQWERQKRFSRYKSQGIMAVQWHLTSYFWLAKCYCSKDEWEEEEGEKINHENNFPNCPFLASFKKINTSTFWCMVTLLILVQFTPSEGPKSFTNCSFHKFDHGMKPFNVGQLHGPWCKHISVYVKTLWVIG